MKPDSFREMTRRLFWPGAGVLGAVVVLWTTWMGWQVWWDRRFFGEDVAGVESTNLLAAEAVASWRANPHWIVLDVRSEAEARGPGIPGAHHAPRGSEEWEVFLESTARDQEILVYCGGGLRSRLALEPLRAAGFRRLYHVNGGLWRWKAAGGPVE